MLDIDDKPEISNVLQIRPVEDTTDIDWTKLDKKFFAIKQGKKRNVWVAFYFDGNYTQIEEIPAQHEITSLESEKGLIIRPRTN